MTRARTIVPLLALALSAPACSPEEPAGPGAGGGPPSSATSSGGDPVPTPSPDGSATTGSAPPSATAAPSPPPAVSPGDLDRTRAVQAVRFLAGRIGPRHATSPAYARAANWLARELADAGYRVRRQRFRAPAGTSWGVPVRGGPTQNVLADPPGFEPTEPHLVVGAHLDTVPVAPGAEDNASGVGVLLAVADAVADRSTRLPVRFVVFGAEEPRGPTDDDHHYGSRAYVSRMAGPQREALRAMVSLDRVGVGGSVPVGSARRRDPVQRALLGAADRAGVPAFGDPFSRSSDHWSFVRSDLPAARLGSTPYAAYHSAEDLPPVVQQAQLARTGRLVLAWLADR
jgi:aminopeptidase YwaD